MKKTSKMKLLILVLVIIPIVLFLAFYQSPTEQWKQLIQNNNYEEASNVLSNHNNIDNEVVSAELKKIVENTKNEFRNQTLSYMDALARLTSLKTMNSEMYLIDEATSYVNQLNDSAIAYEKAAQKFETGEFKEAILLYKQVDSEDINYYQATSNAEKAISAYRDTVISKADMQQTNHSYNLAIQIIDEALSFLEGDILLIEQKNIISQNAMNYYEQLSFEAEQSQDYLQAIEHLETASLYDKNNEKTYNKQIEALYTTLFDTCLAQADAIFQIPQEHYMEAATFLEPILNSYPNETRIRDKYMYYLSYQPVYLFEQKPFQKSTDFGSSPSTGCQDNRGNEYNYMYKCGALYEIDADWKLDKKYDLLTGVIVVPSGDYDTNVNGKVRIYGDGILLWEKSGIDASTAPENISIDISEVDVLQIYMKGGIGSLKKCTVMVADFTVQKTKR